MKSAPWSCVSCFVAAQAGRAASACCSASQLIVQQLAITDSVGAKHDKRGKMAEATARAASIKRYGEALGDLALAEE